MTPATLAAAIIKAFHMCDCPHCKKKMAETIRMNLKADKPAGQGGKK